jgi:hypothetical protein
MSLRPTTFSPAAIDSEAAARMQADPRWSSGGHTGSCSQISREASSARALSIDYAMKLLAPSPIATAFEQVHRLQQLHQEMPAASIC